MITRKYPIFINVFLFKKITSKKIEYKQQNQKKYYPIKLNRKKNIPEKEKILFITHSSNLIYGAAKSLKYILQNSEMEFDIVFNKKLFHGELYDKKTILDYCGSKLENSYSMVLPFSRKVCDCGKTSMFNKIADFIVYYYGLFITKYKLQRLIKKNQYKYIYLNSLVLINLINKKGNYILHVREVFKGNPRIFKYIVSKMKLCKGVIFIDSSTESSFKNEKIRKIILNNPFDMRDLNGSKIEITDKFKLNKDKVNILMAGVLSDVKGTNFIIDTFRNIKTDKYQLIIVGSGEEKYVSNVKKIIHESKNIVFIPEQKDLSELLKVSDFVIRGENFFCIGRTIYEALYSGIGVIIPGKQSDIKNIYDYDLFVDKIHIFKPGDTVSLINLICELEKNVYKKNHKDNNLDEYISSFFRFLKES
ncbi:glycosyltransferase [[Eubacterium] hominis]|uniref:glycosyltransferase n=1 Tax=[Eubacterium] hominis TaxID=2764325 RepID=UPI003A4DCA67